VKFNDRPSRLWAIKKAAVPNRAKNAIPNMKLRSNILFMGIALPMSAPLLIAFDVITCGMNEQKKPRKKACGKKSIGNFWPAPRFMISIPRNGR
jgi:hypothetical protein